MEENTRVPVFVFPTALTFYTKSRESHKQVLSLYNPYEVPVEFIVKSTAPTKYTVIDPEGSIAPQTLVDITIRHLCPNAGNSQIKDKFRVLMRDKLTKKILGKRDLKAELIDGFQEDLHTSDEPEHNFRYVSQKKVLESIPDNSRHNHNMPKQPSWLVVIIGLLCICGLFLPTDLNSEPANTYLPAIRLSISVKVILSFVLGMVTMTVLRP